MGSSLSSVCGLHLTYSLYAGKNLVTFSYFILFQYSSVVLGLTAANSVGLVLDLAGRFTTDSAYVFDSLVGLVDVGDGCTDGDVNTDIGDFRSDKTVEAYWVDVTEQVERIR